jgi:hypothetical protein
MTLRTPLAYAAWERLDSPDEGFTVSYRTTKSFDYFLSASYSVVPGAGDMVAANNQSLLFPRS